MTTELQSLIQKYEQFLVDKFTLSSSFKEITDGRLKTRRRLLLIAFLILLLAYVCKSLVYFGLKIEDPKAVTSSLLRSLLARSTSECTGRVSILYEVALCFGMILGILYKVTLLINEQNNRLDLATDFQSFLILHQREGKDLKRLKPESEARFVRVLKYCLIAMRLLNPCVCMQFAGLHVVLCAVSVYYSESAIVSAYYIFFTLYIVMLFETCLYPVFTVHIMTVIASEYTIQRLQDLVQDQQDFLYNERSRRERVTRESVIRDHKKVMSLIAEYNDISGVISRHNVTVSPILLQSVVVLLPTFACIFAFSAFDFEPLLKVLLMMLAATFCTTMFLLLGNAGRVWTHARKPMNLFFSMQARKRLRFKDKQRLLLMIHRIGETVDGIGFTCGLRIPFTIASVLLLLVESTSYTFLIMEQFFYRKKTPF